MPTNNNQNHPNEKITTGGCLCGAVRYQVNCELRNVVNCHCGMCRQLHGCYGAHSKASKRHIELTKDKGLIWYKSSEIAERGFCCKCGTNLFWQPYDRDSTGIVAGSLDLPTSLSTMAHIFVADKPDYYEITDDLPQYRGSSRGEIPNDNQ